MPPEPRPPVTGTTGQPSWLAPVMPVVPDHELLRRIGGGSYGDVWLARTAVGTWRAVKVVFRDRFTDARPYEREFNGMQKFEPLSRGNEGFIDILQIGRNDAEGYFYYVMELADDAGEVTPVFQPASKTGPPTESEPTGKSALQPETYVPKTLSKVLLQRGRLPLGECLELGLTLNLGLAHLHRAGLIHRDIKPSNIIFVGGVPKLADIGLVIETAEARSYVGTEGFIPPEGPNSPQADLFSLGKVLYEAGMGKDRKDFPEPFTQIIDAPDSKQLLEFNAILLKACAANVTERYQSAEEMNADLALLQSGGSVRRQRKLAGQLRFVQRAGALVTALAAVIALGLWWQAGQTRIMRDLAAQKSQLAEENRERLIRLDIANGVRLMDEGDLSGALVWFADALPLVTNNPPEETIHRIRIQQAFSQSPRLLRVLGSRAGLSGAFSPDGRRLATGVYGTLHIWDAESGESLVKPLYLWKEFIHDLRFTKDGKRLLARSCSDQGRASIWFVGKAAVIDAATCQLVYPSVSNTVRSAFSPDDRWLAVARTNHVIELLEASSGRHIVELSGHTNDITMLSFSRDGTLLASASWDQTVRLWRVPSGDSVGPPIHHSQPVVRAVFSPDARRLATATEDRAGGKWCFIHTWDVASGTEIGSPIQAISPVKVLAFDETADHRLITGDGNNWIDVRNADSHAALFSPLRFASPARCWAFSPDGLWFAAGSLDGTACVWNLETGEPLIPRLHHVGWVQSLQFSPDGTRLLTTSDDDTAKIWDLSALSEAAKPLELGINIAPVDPASFPHALSPDGHRLIVALALNEPVAQTVNLDTLTEEGAPLPGPDGDLLGQIQFDNRGRQWAAALGYFGGNGRSRSVSLWRREGEKVRQFTLPHPKAVRFFQFSADGEQLFSLGDDRVLRSWRTTNGTLAAEVKLPDDFDSARAISPDGKRVVSMWENSDLRLFDVEKPQADTVPLASKNSSNIVRFSPDGNRFAGVGPDQSGHIWDARTGQPLTPRFKHGDDLFWVEWSPDGRRVVTAGVSDSVKLWDAATGEPVLAPMGSKGAVRIAHYSPDGRFLVTRSDDHTARVWDATRAEAITPILHHAAEVRAALITTNNRLVTVSDPAIIRAWDLTETRFPAAVIADYARLLAGRKLDRAGVLQKIESAELIKLEDALRASHPELFTTSNEELREWHRRQVQEPTSLARVTAGLFHLERLAELDPGNSSVKQQQARFRGCQIPPRDPATRPELIDLTPYFNASLAASWHGGGGTSNHLAELPRGVHTFAGTDFDVRGLIQVTGDVPESAGRVFLKQVNGIRVGRKLTRLQFLHAVQGEVPEDGTRVGHYLIHFTNGQSEELPIIYGRDARDWWEHPDSPVGVTDAVIAWKGSNPGAVAAGMRGIRLFKRTWSNPLPDIEVASIDFVAEHNQAHPFLVALTAE